MATVKILDLPYITTLQPNTANTVIVGVDIPSDTTGQITLTTLARNLYSNNNLYVGNGDVTFANSIGEFVGNSNSYLQVVLQNRTANGSGDFVITSDDGDDATFYLDMGMNGSTYNDPDYSAMKAHDGYLYVQGDGTGANLVLGTTHSTSRVNFIVGGTESANIVGYFDSTGIYSSSINSLVAANVATLRGEITANAASANSVFNTRISANVATLRGEITANADSANSVINTRISANIATANLFTQAAFDKANNALANTSGTFAGNLTTTGNIISRYAITVNNASMPGNTQYIVVTGTATGNIGTPSNPGYTFHSAVDGGNRVVAESYSDIASDYASFIGRRARGTAAAPAAIQNGDTIVRFGGNAFGSTKFSQFSDARIEYVATENHSDTAKGTRIRFLTTKDGLNTASEIATFNANSVTFTGVVGPEKGFIYTPRILTGAQTAITIDFATDSMIRATFTGTLTMSFTNYTYGKVVEVWVTNTAGTGQTINLGTQANNSTTGATSLSVASQRSAKLQYFSIDGDLSNTFVAVTYN